MTKVIPQGFQMMGVHCGLKRKPEKQDLSLVYSLTNAVAAGVYTKNLVFAAPVALDRKRTPSEKVRAVVINSGNANACTGDRGLNDAMSMARTAAEALGIGEEQVLVLSTGVIGEFLPMDKIVSGITHAAGLLGAEEDHLVATARGMMTTDTVHKTVTRVLQTSQGEVQLTGMAKGAAMIGPNMATMLGVILTDARLHMADAQALLREAADDSFNCLSIEGHTSTNDSVLLLASGAACPKPLKDDDLAVFRQGLQEVCVALARAIANDGEGATHLITLQVEGCASRDSALQIAKTVANSPLVKTAIGGADPNWGRIVSAAGYAGVPFDPQGVTLHVQGMLLYQKGRPAEFEEQTVSTAIRDSRETSIVLRFTEGQHNVRFWTTDLTAEYVHLNADYHT